MAKGVYACIDGVSRNVKQIPLCIDGVSRNTKEGWACVDGVSRQFFPSAISMSSLSVGDSVFMNVNGVRTEFLIVHQGQPSSNGGTYTNAYGMWLLAKDIYTMRCYSVDNYTYYANSEIHNYLNTTFFNMLDAGVASHILQAGLPCTISGSGSSGALGSVTAKVFLLSLEELYGQMSYFRREGGPLNYFQYSGSESVLRQRRTGYYNGKIESWFTRTHEFSGYSNAIARGTDTVNEPGSMSTMGGSASQGIRPAMIFPYDTALDENFNIIA